MTADEIVAEVREAAGIDVPDPVARILRWVNHLIREAAAYSHWVLSEPELGPTVADQSNYDLAANIVQVFDLSVGGEPYEREGTRTVRDLRAGRLTLRGPGGFFAPAFDADGSTKQFTLFPTPSTSGLPIAGLCSLYPAEISGSMEPPFPDDTHIPIVHGAKAIGLALTEENEQSAQYHRAIWEEAKENLRRLGNKRLSSRNPSIKLAV